MIYDLHFFIQIMINTLLSFHPWLLLMLQIISFTTGEEVIQMDFQNQNHTQQQCNQICNYVEWAQDANCQHCNLLAIPAECHQAVMLDLGHNNISSIPSGAFKPFRNLFYVDLEGNSLMEIDPGAFDGNSETRYIYLHGNQLQTIENGTFS